MPRSPFSLRAKRASLVASLLVALGPLVVACAPRPAAETPGPEVPMATLPFVPGFVPDSLMVRLTTSRGDLDVLVRTEWAPLGAQRFYEAVSSGYYDDARFFRTIRAFVAQFGIAADSVRTHAWRARTILDDSVRQTNRRGTLVFASGGPNTRTVQLFFNLRDNPRLDALGFAPIGEIVRGHDALDALHTGYGDGATAPSQDRLNREGEAYLAAEFPLLDKIRTARVIRTWPAAPTMANTTTPPAR